MDGRDAKPLWSINVGAAIEQHVTLAHLNGDATFDCLITSVAGKVCAVSGVDGRLLWQVRTGTPHGLASPSVADLDTDGFADYVVTSSSRLRGDESIDGHECAVIDLVPETLDLGYGRIRVWLDRQELVTRKYEFQSEQGATEKTLLLSEIRLVGRIPSAHRLEMRNERTHSRTVVDFSKIEYDVGLDDDTFTQRRLERGV